jgi:hypothetical protein
VRFSQIRLKRNKEMVRKKKEKVEAHLYTIIKSMKVYIPLKFIAFSSGFV